MKSDRLSNETAKAYEAFRIFCDLGAQRSMAKVARKLGKSQTLISKWSTRHGWPDRVKEFDAKLVKIQRDSEQKAIEQQSKSWAARTVGARENAWSMAQELRAKARKMMEWPLERITKKNGKTIINPARWTMNDAARFVDVATKLEYLSTGQSTERVSHTGPDGEGPVQIQAEITPIPFDPAHVRECYKAQARREVEKEMEEAQKLLQNAENHEQTPNEKEQNQNGNGETHP